MIYLNNAATSFPKAPGTAQAVAMALETPPQDVSRSTASERTGHDCRALLAEWLGCGRGDVVLTPNATFGLNTALLGFPWNRGDVVVTTRAEHNSVLRPLYQLKKRGVIDYVELPVQPDGRVALHDWKAAMAKYKPRLAVFTHASNASGAVNDARALTREASAVGASVLVDASQTMGLIPVAPVEWGADMVAFTGHKYLLGPTGTGGLYVRKGLTLEPVFTGGTGVRSDEDDMPLEMPLRLEAGTGNEASFAGLAASLRYARENPLEPAHFLRLLSGLEEGIHRAGMEYIEVRGPRTPIVAAWSPVYRSEILGEMLALSFDIICRAGLHCAPHYPAVQGGTVRFSLSRFTTEEEIEAVCDALWAIHSD